MGFIHKTFIAILIIIGILDTIAIVQREKKGFERKQYETAKIVLLSLHVLFFIFFCLSIYHLIAIFPQGKTPMWSFNIKLHLHLFLMIFTYFADFIFMITDYFAVVPMIIAKIVYILANIKLLIQLNVDKENSMKIKKMIEEDNFGYTQPISDTSSESPDPIDENIKKKKKEKDTKDPTKSMIELQTISSKSKKKEDTKEQEIKDKEEEERKVRQLLVVALEQKDIDDNIIKNIAEHKLINQIMSVPQFINRSDEYKEFQNSPDNRWMLDKVDRLIYHKMNVFVYSVNETAQHTRTTKISNTENTHDLLFTFTKANTLVNNASLKQFDIILLIADTTPELLNNLINACKDKQFAPFTKFLVLFVIPNTEEAKEQIKTVYTAENQLYQKMDQFYKLKFLLFDNPQQRTYLLPPDDPFFQEKDRKSVV